MLYGCAAQVFDMMPIAALVDDIAFCVHGGIGHHVTSIAQVEKIKRPCKVRWSTPRWVLRRW
jgi:hypothetical protein